MAFNSVDSHHIGSGLSQCVTGNFTSAVDRNLLVAKSTRIELYIVTDSGVRPLKEILLYGRVALMKAFRAKNEKKDFLFVMSNKYNVAVLEFVRTGNITSVVTRAHGNVADANSRPVETRPLCAVDPMGRAIGLRLFDGFFKVIPLDRDNKELLAFNVRMKEQNIWDIQFLHDCLQPTIALICEDSNCRQLKTYELSVCDEELVRVTWKRDNVEPESSILIAVPQPFGGAIIVGQQSIFYLSGENKYCAIASSPIRQSTITSYSPVDASRYLLGDMSGRLFLLELRSDANDVVRDLKLELLGEIPVPECLTYLESGLIYVGSRVGDPQLIHLNLEHNQNGSHLEVLETLSNSETFDDMITVDIDRHRQRSLTNSGLLSEVDRHVRHDPYLSLESVHSPKPMAVTDNRQRKSQSVRSRSQSVDCQSMGGIFDIDLEVEEGNAFDSISYSDDEDEGSDDSIAFRNTTNEYNSLNKGRTIPTPQHNAQQNQSMAYSLPIQVPKWKAFHRHNDNIDDEEVAMIPNGEAIGESIKKLAKSVRNDSEIFGDRPRRRTNTFVDLIKSRPQ